ncbi:MAG TPA: CheR family methyltransferase [Polyangiaceae bacterium]|nr:CheR family methyltransferase [Polyangiaceae bacterium]
MAPSPSDPGPPPGGSSAGGAQGSVTPTDQAVDRVLQFAQARFGLGCGPSSPTWVRPRVLALLQTRAARQGVPVEAIAEGLHKDAGAVAELELALRVGETRFYRDPGQWQAIEQHVLKTIPARVEIRVLCAGCSTGEEAYTAAMLLRHARRQFFVLGVDRSAAAIDVAKKGVYGPDAIRDLPAAYLSRFCEIDGGTLRVRRVVSELVHFRQMDLVKSIPEGGPFQLIFFKNVLLYLPEPTGERVARDLVDKLDEPGLLFPAASEVLRLRSAGLTPVRVTPQVTAFRRSSEK